MKTLTQISLIAALTATSVGVHAISQTVSNRQNMSMFLDSYGNVYIAGNCLNNAPCGPLTGAIYNQATYAGFQNAKYVFASPYANAIIDQDGGVYYSGTITYTAPAMEWTALDIPGEAVDAAWDTFLNLWVLAKTDAGTELFKFNLRSLSVEKIGDRTDWLQIDASESVVALDVYGNLYGWGRYNDMYGNGGVTTDVPPATPTVEGIRFRKVTTGKRSVVGITTDNVPMAWGSKADYTAGLDAPASTPTAIPGMPEVKDAVLTDTATMFIDTEGTLVLAGWTNLRSYMGQALKTVSGTNLEIPYQDTGLTLAYTPTALANGSGAANFYFDNGTLMGWSSNQRGELAVGTDTPEYHYITRSSPFVGTPPMLSERELEEALDEGRNVDDLLSEKRKDRCNASANNGRGGNYDHTVMCDNGKGKGRDIARTARKNNKVFTARTDGRGFKRSGS